MCDPQDELVTARVRFSLTLNPALSPHSGLRLSLVSPDPSCGFGKPRFGPDEVLDSGPGLALWRSRAQNPELCGVWRPSGGCEGPLLLLHSEPQSIGPGSESQCSPWSRLLRGSQHPTGVSRERLVRRGL